MQEPRVSVVTPSFNQARFLGQTIRSVLFQRRDIHEYFVLDGGSTDGSRELIERYAGQIDFWTSEHDDGQATAIDRGFRMATGDVVYWLNSDDVLLPGAVSRVRSFFAAAPGVEVITGFDYVIDSDSRVVRVRRPPRQTLSAAQWGVLHVSQPTCFMRREAYLAVGGIDPSLGCVLDTELWIRLLRRSPQWGHVPEFLAAFRTHEAQKGRAWIERYAREQKILAERHRDVLGSGLKHQVGAFAFRTKEALRGRYLRDAASTWWQRGRQVPGTAEQGP